MLNLVCDVIRGQWELKDSALGWFLFPKPINFCFKSQLFRSLAKIHILPNYILLTVNHLRLRDFFFFPLLWRGKDKFLLYTHFQKGWDLFSLWDHTQDSSFIGLSICKMWKYIQQLFIKFLPPYSKGYQVPGYREVKRQIMSLLTESLYLSRRTRFQTYI